MWGEKMKRLVIAVLIACMLLSGCGVIHDSMGTGRQVPSSELDLSGLDMLGSTKKAAVYFLNSANGTLTADPRTLRVEQNTNPAEAAIKALLEGPSNDTLTSVAPDGMALDAIEFSNGVANIYISYDGMPMESVNKYTMELAIANTVSDLLGATAVNIFYNGLREGFDRNPSAPLKKQTGPVIDAYKNAMAKYVPPQPAENESEASPSQTPKPNDETPVDVVPKTNTISTVLYFVSASGDYILPEVRDVTYTTTGTSDEYSEYADYVETILNELKVAPLNTTTMESPIESNASLIGKPEVIDNGDGTFDIALSFDILPAGVSYTVSKQEQPSYAAMVYTITGFIPYVRAVRFYVDETPVMQLNGTKDATRRSDLGGYIGSSAPLFLQYADSGLLIEVSRSMEQGKIWSALERVRAIMQGPQIGDGGNVGTVQFAGMTEGDILSVDVYNDTAYVDLSARFKEACKNHTAQDEMLLVYAIVNTVTAMDGINKVQFLVEGAQTDTLGGHLYISDPFLRNYGIIKNGS